MARLLLQGALRRPRAAGWAGVLLLSVLLAACSGDDDDTQPLQLRTVSNRADLVSDGDVLMEIVPPSGSSANALKVTVGDRDVSSAFSRTASGRILGVVTGLAAGNNTVRAAASDAATAHIVVNNSPRSGPVLSGAQTMPFYCATTTPQAANGNVPQTAPSGLAGTADANCGIATETKLYYRTTAAAPAGGCSLPDPFSNTTIAQPAAPAVQCWKEYTPGSQPADMAAAVTTDAGVTVPFIVRVERGTMNRGIYDIAVLFDPSKPWTPAAPQAGWNGKVWYTFGASTGQPRRQVRPDNSNRWPLQEEQLKRGFLVAANSMTDSSRNSNRISMSETVMMMKEHVIDTYGLVKFTIGTGCSGGSINSNMNLSAMPGLLDGVITSCTYPDSETTAIEVGDCSQLVEAYQKPQMLALWTGLPQATINAKKAAINGHPDQTGCQAWFNYFGSNGKAGLYNFRHVNPADTATGVITQDATPTNNCELPNSVVYDPANPVATASLPRCNAWSWAESLWGKVPGSPAARETRDNTGVQYGLAALLNGTITPEEFVTLNEVVGGFDHDSTPTAARAAADSDALATAYRAGIVGSGKQLAKGAIIDLRGWDDSTVNRPPSLPAAAALGIHHQWFSWAIRERITRDAGDANNQVLWRFAATGLSAPGTLSLEALQTMDQWLASLVAAGGSGTIESRVRAAKPANARDFCILTSDATQSTKVYDQGACDADPFLKPAASPRQVAGGPRAEDILKCQLKPLSTGDYPAGLFTASQFARLQAVFTGGVCDWTKAGVGQQAVASPLTFKSGPGGTALGNPPVSVQD